ncbi:DeoR/GlpR family DNA-binding transcription regulator [Aeromicrobium massiliense]|uniref:DeoR/GlpR family DNA-binding transcription regulator n=1 Tax=Aeromicrobium massiliense TaxID=1464554 RepID=UPI0005770DF8|nr:DeoR/GlpR family DNA-binding transcription regulator [Aeromicrobium massiliense]
MQRSQRHKAIIQAVSGGATLGVDDLRRLTGASAVTVRRDLAELAAAGAVTRTHGGVRRAAKRGTQMPFGSRFEADLELKSRLGAAAAALVEDDESLVLDNGTTCLAVARALAGRPVTVLALSLHGAAALAARPGASVVVPGGPVETDSLALVGSDAVDAVRAVRVDVAVLGACSASTGDGLTSTTPEDAAVKRACLEVARRRVLVATPDKLGRSSTFRFGAPSDLTHLVTTDDAPAEALAGFRGAGVEVLLV